MTFEELVRRASGHGPYPYQKRIAEEGLPDLLRAPTGTGKTLAATLPWIWRRMFHPDQGVRRATPHWLVFVLPMRVLVEQTHDAIQGWLRQADLTQEVDLYRVMGGEGRVTGAWRTNPERDTILVGTVDMLLSRALNRGYAVSRFAWPIEFGLFNSGVQWVFDEVQLLGPALPTSRQLHGLRQVLGTAAPSASMWMSATVDESAMSTVDCPGLGRVVDLTADDRDPAGALYRRLEATRTVRRIPVSQDPALYPADVAQALVEQHRLGTRTIAVLNTVDRARQVFKALSGRIEAATVLLHSRFRPAERRRQVDAALAGVDPAGPGTIVVSTQVLEAGVDLTSTTMLTEAAAWPSIVQRAGRCNRDGDAAGATFLWCSAPSSEPYETLDVAATVRALDRLEGEAVTGRGLADTPVEFCRPVHPVLRRRDLLGLFDTTPDLSGNDLDVGRFIRDADDLDCQVAWRSLSSAVPASDDQAPTAEELCAVPVGQLRKALKTRTAWRFDHLGGGWARCEPSGLRPGQLLLLRSEEGGYTAASGWDPASGERVAPIASLLEEPLPGTSLSETTGDNATTFVHTWQPLFRHLVEVEAAVRRLATIMALPGLSAEHLEAAAVAGRLHDLGKVHPEFQSMLVRSAAAAERDVREAGRPWAKSDQAGPARSARRYFRHELASALALLGEGSLALHGEAEPDLVVYLVAAHHGRVRLGIRSLPGEGEGVALGIHDGEVLPAVDVPGVRVPETTLDLSVMAMGSGREGNSSWAQRAITLRDRPDLGPFRLAFLEALVRLADWRASEKADLAAMSDEVSS